VSYDEWHEIDQMLKIASTFILTEDERRHIARLEQSALFSGFGIRTLHTGGRPVFDVIQQWIAGGTPIQPSLGLLFVLC
jgi:hypothetical protein